jgi:transcriptional regulator with XRE-family HTH domain
MPDRHRRRAGTHRRRGRERAFVVARRIGFALRDARRRAGLRQVDIAERAGISQSFYSRLERGLATSASVETLAASAEAVGHQLAAFLELAPGATPPRDVEHLRTQQLVVVAAAAGEWRATPEAALPDDGPWPRSIDVLLRRPARGETAVVEVVNYLADVGDAIRNLEAKVLAVARRETVGTVAGLLLVRRTRRNRQVVSDLRTLFAARYPGSSSAWLRALRDPTAPMPAEAGFAWTSVRGDRLAAARLA